MSQQLNEHRLIPGSSFKPQIDASTAMLYIRSSSEKGITVIYEGFPRKNEDHTHTGHLGASRQNPTKTNWRCHVTFELWGTLNLEHILSGHNQSHMSSINIIQLWPQRREGITPLTPSTTTQRQHPSPPSDIDRTRHAIRELARRFRRKHTTTCTHNYQPICTDPVQQSHGTTPILKHPKYHKFIINAYCHKTLIRHYRKAQKKTYITNCGS